MACSRQLPIVRIIIYNYYYYFGIFVGIIIIIEIDISTYTTVLDMKKLYIIAIWLFTITFLLCSEHTISILAFSVGLYWEVLVLEPVGGCGVVPRRRPGVVAGARVTSSRRIGTIVLIRVVRRWSS